MLDDLQKSVSDPTDFPREVDAPGLRQLDSAFRCGICSEIYDAPLMLLCGHSFCSMCARQSLRERSECPQCRKPAEEVQLMKNVQLEELSASWRLARTFMLQLLEKVNRSAKEALDGANERPKKKRKLSNPVTPKARRVGSPSTPIARISALKLGSRSGATDVDIAEDSEEETSRGDYVPSSDTEENEVQLESEQIVPCPICEQHVLVKNADSHIDSGCTALVVEAGAGPLHSKRTDTKIAWVNMLNGASAKPSSRTRGKGKESQQKSPLEAIGDSVERLPRPSYNVLKDKKIREMLAEYQLAMTGSREQMIARHSQYVLMFNANLDRAERLRKPVSELRKELRKWEDSMATKKYTIGDTRAYLKANTSDFRRHIEAAKATARRPRVEEREGSNLMPERNGSHHRPRLATPSPKSSGSGVGETTSKIATEGDVVPDSQGEDLA